MRYESLIDSIGNNTPLVRLRGCGGAALYAKMELFNPFGHKDRFARHLLLKAKAAGELKANDIIIESSSGTLALGLTLVGRALGHEVHIVTDPRTDTLTIAKLHALGAVIHVVDSPNEHGWQGARLDKVHELMCDFPGAFWPKQYTNPDNPAAFAAIAEELVDDIGQVDVLVAPVGSGGLLCGTARALKQFCPKLLVVAVDAVGSVIFDQPHNSNRLLNGLGNSLVPSNVDKRIIDDVHWLNDDEGFAATLRLAYDEQIFAGGSAGSAYWVSRWLAAEMSTGSTVVVMFPDRGDRYYQTVYDPHYREAHGLCLGQLPSSPQEVVYGLPVTSWSYAKIQ